MSINGLSINFQGYEEVEQFAKEKPKLFKEMLKRTNVWSQIIEVSNKDESIVFKFNEIFTEMLKNTGIWSQIIEAHNSGSDKQFALKDLINEIAEVTGIRKEMIDEHNKEAEAEDLRSKQLLRELEQLEPPAPVANPEAPAAAENPLYVEVKKFSEFMKGELLNVTDANALELLESVFKVSGKSAMKKEMRKFDLIAHPDKTKELSAEKQKELTELWTFIHHYYGKAVHA
jgi:hypothetical protein